MLKKKANMGRFADHFALPDKKDQVYHKRKTTARLASDCASTDYSPRRLEDFLQGEHGIRDSSVAGVQTCALPIYGAGERKRQGPRRSRLGPDIHRIQTG